MNDGIVRIPPCSASVAELDTGDELALIAPDGQQVNDL